ncbi:MAG TPA: carbohydrate kinase family protein, partial [Candidatus Saccharimonadales bacterium]
MADNPDVISVGDIVTDVFIKLLDDQAEVIEKDDTKLLAMTFGSKLPFDFVETIEAVGNSGNSAVSLARLGLDSALVTNVGSDNLGRDMISTLDKNEVDTRFVRINRNKKSVHHYVLWYKAERTILIKNGDYSYHWPHLRPDEIPKWVYLTSINEHAHEYHDQIADWLEEHEEVKLAFQPGTFQIESGAHRLHRIYKRTEVLVLNREEAVAVGGGDHENVNDLIDKLHELGPKIVVVTDGPNGAYASDGTSRFSMPLYPDPAPPYERTGAGDAFASTFVASLIKGNNVEGALMWAPINSMSVVQKVGAQAGLLSEHQLEEYLRKAPDWYHPSILN